MTGVQTCALPICQHTNLRILRRIQDQVVRHIPRAMEAFSHSTPHTCHHCQKLVLYLSENDDSWQESPSDPKIRELKTAGWAPTQRVKNWLNQEFPEVPSLHSALLRVPSSSTLLWQKCGKLQTSVVDFVNQSLGAVMFIPANLRPLPPGYQTIPYTLAFRKGKNRARSCKAAPEAMMRWRKSWSDHSTQSFAST